MENSTEYRNEAIQPIPKLALTPFQVDDETSIVNYEKIPFSRLNSLGVAFEPISTAVQNVFGSSSGTTQLCKVTIPSGTHLASFKNGAGNLGTALNANNQIAGQAIINPLVCNPTMIFMAAALANIDKKLDSIQEIQQEMLEFLEQKEKSELRGDLKFLTDILDNYRYNWNNDMYKRSCHVKTLDIRQSASQKVDFYQKQITSKLQKKVFLHSDQDVKKQLEKISSEFKDYQLALYLFSFSSFIV